MSQEASLPSPRVSNKKLWFDEGQFILFNLLLTGFDVVFDIFGGIWLLMEGKLALGISTLSLLFLPAVMKCLSVILVHFSRKKSTEFRLRLAMQNEVLRHLPVFQVYTNWCYLRELHPVKTDERKQFDSKKIFDIKRGACYISQSEAFFEAGPQLALKLGILWHSTIYGWFEVLTTITSFISLSNSAASAFFSQRSFFEADLSPPPLYRLLIIVLQIFVTIPNIFIWVLLGSFMKFWVLLLVPVALIVKYFTYKLFEIEEKFSKELKHRDIYYNTAYSEFAIQSMLTSLISPCIVGHSSSDMLTSSGWTTSIAHCISITLLVNLHLSGFIVLPSPSIIWWQIVVLSIISSFSAQLMSHLQDYRSIYKLILNLQQPLCRFQLILVKPHRSTLYSASYKKELEIFEEIVRLFPDIRKRRKIVSHGNFSGKTPLHEACDEGQGKQILVEILLVQCDAKRFKKDSWGKIPLHYASLHGHVCSVRLLMAKDENSRDRENILEMLKIEDKYGFLPVDYAIKRWDENKREHQNLKARFDKIGTIADFHNNRRDHARNLQDDIRNQEDQKKKFQTIANYLIYPKFVDNNPDFGDRTQLPNVNWEGQNFLHFAVRARNIDLLLRFLSPSIKSNFEKEYERVDTEERGILILKRLVTPELKRQLLDEYSTLSPKDQCEFLYERLKKTEYGNSIDCERRYGEDLDKDLKIRLLKSSDLNLYPLKGLLGEKDDEGRTPLELAVELGYTLEGDLLRNASE